MAPAPRARVVLAALSALHLLLVTGNAAKVTYTTGPMGPGPAGYTGYKGGPANCGSGSASDTTALLWNKQLSGYNDSIYNPQLTPVTRLEIRPMTTVKMAWGAKDGLPHGLLGLTTDALLTLVLRPGEVITQVSWVGYVGRDGRMTDFSVTTNASRTWTPPWPYEPEGEPTPYVARPPTAAEWTGPPIVGDWYLAYTWASPIGYCCNASNNGWCSTQQQLKANKEKDEGALWFFTPKLWFVWAADTAPPASPSPVKAPTPPPASPMSRGVSPSPATTTAAPKSKGKGVSMGLIAGAAGAGVAAIAILALVAAWFIGRRTAASKKAAGAKSVLPVSTVAPGFETGGGGEYACAIGGGGGGGVFKGGGAAAVVVAGGATAATAGAGVVRGANGTAASMLKPSAKSSDLLPPRGFSTTSSTDGFALPAAAISHSSGAVIASNRRAGAASAPMPGMGGASAGGGALPLAVVGAAGLAVGATIMLAREILDAGDRVVANHTRCLRLTSRIQSILPLLNSLQDHLNRQANERGGDGMEHMQGMMDSMAAVFRDVKDCIDRWCGPEASARGNVLLQILRNLALSKKFEDEFLDLNDRLSGCYQDLILALNIKHALSDNDPDRLREQYEQDSAADLKGVAEELSTAEGEDAWNRLPAAEKHTIRDAFGHHGLNFNTLMTQARKNAVGNRVKDLTIPLRDLTLTAEIGSGGYGTVYRGTWQDIEVAVKKLQLTVVTERAKRELSHEAYVMSLLRHPNVAVSYGLVLEPPTCALVMKYYKRGTLLELLHDDSQPVTLRRKLQLALDVAKGMAYLHNRPTDAVIHGDLKPSNLLMDDNGKVVITDFGLSKVSTLTLTTKPSSSAMSITYAAPEILADPTCRRSTAVDVYAYGLVLFEIFTREPPFGPATDVMAVVQYVLGGGRPRVAGPAFDTLQVPREVVELMQQCWQQVPQARPTFAQIVERLKGVQAA